MPADLATLFAADTPEARATAAKAWADTLSAKDLVSAATLTPQTPQCRRVPRRLGHTPPR